MVTLKFETRNQASSIQELIKNIVYRIGALRKFDALIQLRPSKVL